LQVTSCAEKLDSEQAVEALRKELSLSVTEVKHFTAQVDLNETKIEQLSEENSSLTETVNEA